MIDPPTSMDLARDPAIGAHWHSRIHYNDRAFSQHIVFLRDEGVYLMRLFRYDTGEFLGAETWALADGAFPSLEAAISRGDEIASSHPA